MNQNTTLPPLPTDTDAPALYTILECAQLTRSSVSRLYRLMDLGELRTIKTVGRRHVPRAEMARLLGLDETATAAE